MREKIHTRLEYRKKWISLTEFGIFVLIVFALVLRFRLVFSLNIDVDEFTFLSMVHDFLRGGLRTQFFSFHVHLFSWVPLVSTNEVSQIMAARVLMYVLSIGSVIFTYLIGKVFFNRAGALFSSFCYVSISNVMVHGTSFRFDPISAFLFLASIYFLLRQTQSQMGVIIAGFCISLSLMITLKTLFHLFIIGAMFIALMILSHRKTEVFRKLAIFTGATVIGYILMYYFHVSTLPVEKIPETKEFVANLASSDIWGMNFFPNSPYTMMILLENLSISALWFAGVILILLDFLLGNDKKQGNALILASFLVSFAPLIFYKFVHPYFFVFILSPAIILCGAVIDRAAVRFIENGSKLVYSFIPFMILAVSHNFIVHYEKNSLDRTIGQKEIVNIVHEIFPNPVPYIDRCSMISSFPQVGFQMTTWDMERYTISNHPIMKTILLNDKPVFLLANSVYLDLDSPRGWKRDIFKNYPLLEEDYKILKENFIKHWGIIYVAGKQLDFDTPNRSRSFEILIPGIYTIESEDSIVIDGTVFPPGSKVELARKRHTATTRSGDTKIILRWGENLFVPNTPPSYQPIFTGYYW